MARNTTKTRTPSSRSTRIAEADTPSSGSTLSPARKIMKVRLPGGRTSACAVFIAAFTSLMAAFLVYLMFMATALYGMPFVAALVAKSGGVHSNSKPDVLWAMWIAPQLFIDAAIFVGEIALTRRIWRAARAIIARSDARWSRTTD